MTDMHACFSIIDQSNQLLHNALIKLFKLNCEHTGMAYM